MKKKINLKEYAQSFHGDIAFAPFFSSSVADLKAEMVLRPASALQLPGPEPETYVYTPPREGYVYYCEDGRGRVKIGFSANPWSRCRESKTFNPEIKLLAVEKGTRNLEYERHEEFKDEHLALEWFKLSDRLQTLIKELQGKEQT